MTSFFADGSLMDTLGDFVAQSFLYPDHSGWLVEQTSGKRRWCVIADMLLCVFKDPKSEQPLKVIMLPGHKVKAMVFSSAKPDALIKAGNTYEERSEEQTKTISGIQKHQFAIYTPDSGERCMFGAEDKETVDKWVAMIAVATNLRQDLFTDSDEDSNADSGYTPSSVSGTEGRRSSQGSSVDVCLAESEVKDRSDQCEDQPSGSGHRTTVIPADAQPQPAFTRVKRSSSFGSNKVACPDKTDQMNTANQQEPSAVADGNERGDKHGVTVRRSHSWSHGFKRQGSNKCETSGDDKRHDRGRSLFGGPWSKSAVRTLNPNEDAAHAHISSRSLVTKSLEERIKSIPLPTAIANALLSRRTSADSGSTSKRALTRSKSPSSSFRMRFFKTRSKNPQENVALGDHNEPDVKLYGWLLYKQMLKWSRLFCVISRAHFHTYRSDYPSELPDFVLPLSECSVEVSQSDKQRKHCFKVCHLNAKSWYFAASDTTDLEKWFSVLKEETRTWEDGYAVLKPQSSLDSLASRSSFDSYLSKSFDSNPRSQSLSSNGSVCSTSLSSSNPTAAELADRNNNNASKAASNDADKEEANCEPNDGFAVVRTEHKGKPSRWRPPCPARGLDSSSISSAGSGETGRFLCSPRGPARCRFTSGVKPVFFSMAFSQATNPTKSHFGCRFLLLRPLGTSSEILNKIVSR